jgi:hypothetical protein
MIILLLVVIANLILCLIHHRFECPGENIYLQGWVL